MTKQLKADLSLLSVTVIWGASFALMKQAVSFIPPFTFLAYRYLIASVLLYFLFFKSVNKAKISTFKYGFIIGLTLFAGCALQAKGFLYTSASNSGFIGGLSVVFVPLFLALKEKKLPPFLTIVSIIVAVTGLGLLTIDSSFTLNIGDSLNFLAAGFFALQIIFLSKYSPECNAIGLTVVEMLTVSVLSFAFGIYYEGLSATFTPSSIFALVFTALFCSSLAYSVQTAAQKYTSPTHAALIFLAEPVFSLMFAYFLIGETLTIQGVVGCLLIFLGMLLSEVKFKAKETVTV